MPEESIQSRLDRISTQWTMVFQAHGQDDQGAEHARITLLHRYRGAVYRYLLAVVRNVDIAEELSQHFALQFLQGDFHKADPGKGRFRDYVKTAVVNLARQHFKSEARSPGQLPDEVKDPGSRPQFKEQTESVFVREWRAEVMDQTWNALKEQRPVYHALLRIRANEPSLTSREIAERYTAESAKPISQSNVRKTLERAHGKFADLLVREVTLSMSDPSRDLIRAELEELDLLKYCRSAIDRWSSEGAR